MQRRQLARHDTDDRVLLPVQSDRLVNNVGVRREIASPKFLADHDDAVLAGDVLSRKKSATDGWFDSEHVEIICTDPEARDALRGIATFEIETGAYICGDA